MKPCTRVRNREVNVLKVSFVYRMRVLYISIVNVKHSGLLSISVSAYEDISSLHFK